MKEHILNIFVIKIIDSVKAILLHPLNGEINNEKF